MKQLLFLEKALDCLNITTTIHHSCRLRVWDRVEHLDNVHCCGRRHLESSAWSLSRLRDLLVLSHDMCTMNIFTMQSCLAAGICMWYGSCWTAGAHVCTSMKLFASQGAHVSWKLLDSWSTCLQNHEFEAKCWVPWQCTRIEPGPEKTWKTQYQPHVNHPESDFGKINKN